MIYLDVKDEGTIDGLEASAELCDWVVTPEVGYTVLRGDRGHLDLQVGARYLYLEYQLDDNLVFDNLNLSGPYAGVKFIFYMDRLPTVSHGEGFRPTIYILSYFKEERS